MTVSTLVIQQLIGTETALVEMTISDLTCADDLVMWMRSDRAPKLGAE